MNVANPSFLRGLIARVFSRSVPADGGYVFNLRGRWRYEPRAERCQQNPMRRMWSGEVLAYGWLARQAQDRARKDDSPRKPDPRILALTRS